MSNNSLTFHKILFVLLLAAVNVGGLIMVGVVFLGASNANGEGAPMESAFMEFLRQLAYVVTVSLFFSFIAWFLTRLFRTHLSRNHPLIKNIFWIQLAGFIVTFLLSFLYLWIKFA